LKRLRACGKVNGRIDQARHAVRARRLPEQVAIGVKGFEVEVAMCINQHQLRSSLKALQCLKSVRRFH
jgi:hypothetical protein